MLFTTLFIASLSLCAGEYAERVHSLDYTTPAMTWDEALPLGNGTIGSLVWGDGHPLKISLDRTDLWDVRPVPEYASPEYTYETMRQWEKEGRYDELKAIYEDPYSNRPAPTKIPAGRIEIELAGKPAFTGARLALDDPQATVHFGDQYEFRLRIHATEPVGLFTIRAPEAPGIQLVAPAFGGAPKADAERGIVMGELAYLEYAAPQRTEGENWRAYVQEGWGGFRYAVHVCWEAAAPGTWHGAYSIASSLEGADPAMIARTRAESALNTTSALVSSHAAWWSAYWNQSRVNIPNKVIERQYYLDMYKFGAASRRGSPPITLQGPWTADDGKLPPWKGDYHHDLNTQLSYWPCYAGNHLEEGLAYLDWLWATRETCRAWTQRFFGMPGINVPMTADLENKPMGGWRQYTMSATTGAWLAHHFYLHWQFSADAVFLRERAYPYLHDVSVFLEAVTAKRDASGKRSLALSSSPEIHDNKPNAWFSSITNYDLALIRWCLLATAELADAVGKGDEATHWRQVCAELPAFAVDPAGALLVAKDQPLTESHRHFSHLMAIHPLGLIDPEQGEESRRMVEASLADLARLGTDYWCGYSFAWESNLAARAGDGARAARAQELFATSFVLRNSFHANGDQSGHGHSKFTYRPFTLEGNFASAAGLQEMLLQSHAGAINVFPAVPDEWADISFERLRARGAFLISAQRVGGRVTHIGVESEKGGVCRVRTPWDDAVVELVMAPGEIKTIEPGSSPTR
ncbi:MAG: hypothetical protein AMXMBFR84_32210 [Candidatus Hydrogenedentota bacterium]